MTKVLPVCTYSGCQHFCCFQDAINEFENCSYVFEAIDYLSCFILSYSTTGVIPIQEWSAA